MAYEVPYLILSISYQVIAVEPVTRCRAIREVYTREI